jgi:5-methylcytosine-specific restriction endonuclease McrA
MVFVFVVDSEHRPLAPCHPARARRLLTDGKAAVWRHAPFTLILTRAVPDAQPHSLRLKIDPGSRATGLAVVNDASGQVVWAAELTHRGEAIRAALLARKAVRRSRRQRHTRYRPARFANRRRPTGWLPPSLESRVANVLTWVSRLPRLAQIGALSQELVKFDTHLLQNPEISGVEYQQGTLVGYEVREFVLEKWDRQCAYCHKTGVPLQIEHVVPKSRPGGSNRVGNLAPACRPCNQAKGTQTATEFGHPEVAARATQPLQDAAAVNTSRWALYRRLQASGLRVETGTGGRTKWNRAQRGLPKAHWIDAACVGASTPDLLMCGGIAPLAITATGHGVRQMCGTNRAGFPTRHRTRHTRHFGFATGDLVSARVPAGLKTAGWHVGRVLVRASGWFDVATGTGRVHGISHRYCQLVARRDGYAYAYRVCRSGASSPACVCRDSTPRVV